MKLGPDIHMTFKMYISMTMIKKQVFSGFCDIYLDKSVRWTYVIDVGHRFCVFILCVFVSL